MKVKTKNLIGPALDWAVATCEGFDSRHNYEVDLFDHEGEDYSQLFHCYAEDAEHAKKLAEKAYPQFDVQGVTELIPYTPSTDWSQGGPIIAREFICLNGDDGAPDTPASWDASIFNDGEIKQSGHTALIAAMRCYVASRLGDEVDVPDSLMRKDEITDQEQHGSSL